MSKTYPNQSIFPNSVPGRGLSSPWLEVVLCPSRPRHFFSAPASQLCAVAFPVQPSAEKYHTGPGEVAWLSSQHMCCILLSWWHYLLFSISTHSLSLYFVAFQPSHSIPPGLFPFLAKSLAHWHASALSEGPCFSQSLCKIGSPCLRGSQKNRRLEGIRIEEEGGFPAHGKQGAFQPMRKNGLSSP